MSWGLTDVTVRFGSATGAVTALDAVTLDVPEGAVVGVVGGDGAGKTTLLRALVREVVPTSGSVRAPRAAEIGYLPASSGSWADLSVQENLEFVGRSFGLGRASVAERADELLARAGLDHVRGRLARQLSGGMRRKLGLCLAMVAEPRLLVLDEPSTGVDPVSRVDLWRLVSQAAADGTAVLMSTTYLDEAERCATLLMLDEGHTVAAGTPADALAAMPGVVTATTTPVHPARAWRRGREHHEWWPPGETPAAGSPVTPDLEDVAIVATLARRGAAA
jgi:ABC-2 type transport system ATP-binding protein